MRLTDLHKKQPATIHHIHTKNTPHDPIAARLMTLGFVMGEHIEILAHGWLGKDPILVKVGHSRFALRRNEAERIEIHTEHCA